MGENVRPSSGRSGARIMPSMRKTARMVLMVVFVFMSLTLNSHTRSKAFSDLDARRKQLNDLLDERWQYTLRISPEVASLLGDKRYNNKVSDVSEKAVRDDLEQARRFLAKFEAVDTAGFPDQEALNKTLMVRNLNEQLTNTHFNNWQMPMSQYLGIHLDLPQYSALYAFDTVKDYNDFIARLKAYPKQIEDTTANMRKGMAAKLMRFTSRHRSCEHV